jgi:hypothetical protein
MRGRLSGPPHRGARALAPVLLFLALCVALSQRRSTGRAVTRAPDAAADAAVRKSDACVADFAPCGGGVPSPVKARCCNPRSTCFRRGRYFSQCRPRASGGSAAADTLALVPAVVAAPPRPASVDADICAPDYGVCAAGAGSNSAIPCCSEETFHCVLSSPIFHQCMPVPKRHGHGHGHGHAQADSGRAWYALRSPRGLYGYLARADVAARAADEQAPIVADDKLRTLLPELARRVAGPAASGGGGGGSGSVGGVLRAAVPALPRAEAASVRAALREALPAAAAVVADRGELVVRVGPSEKAAALWDAAMVLASIPQVRDVRLD